jgi:hypothetical protein
VSSGADTFIVEEWSFSGAGHLNVASDLDGDARTAARRNFMSRIASPGEFLACPETYSEYDPDIDVDPDTEGPPVVD